jgi:hypothetical protein
VVPVLSPDHALVESHGRIATTAWPGQGVNKTTPNELRQNHVHRNADVIRWGWIA